MIILLQLIFIGLNAVFACAEIAVISMNDNSWQSWLLLNKRALRLTELLDASSFLATIQIGITLVNL